MEGLAGFRREFIGNRLAGQEKRSVGLEFLQFALRLTCWQCGISFANSSSLIGQFLFLSANPRGSWTYGHRFIAALVFGFL